MLSGRGVFSFFVVSEDNYRSLEEKVKRDEKSVPQNAARRDRNKNENEKLICSDLQLGEILICCMTT